MYGQFVDAEDQGGSEEESGDEDHSEDYYGGEEGGYEEDEEMEPIEFPHILECRYCEKKMRVRETGKFKCPNCGEIDQIDEYGQYVDE